MENRTKFLVALLLLFASSAANADPVSIVATMLTSTYGIVHAMVIAETIISVASVAATIGFAAYTNASAKRKARAAAARQRAEYNAGLSDRTTTLLSAEMPQRTVYGTAYVGGSIVAMFTTDRPAPSVDGLPVGASPSVLFSGRALKPLQLEGKNEDALRHLVVVLTSHEIEGIEGLMVDGSNCWPLSPDGYPTVGDFSSSTNGFISFQTTIPANGVIPLPSSATGVASVTVQEPANGKSFSGTRSVRIFSSFTGSAAQVHTSYAGVVATVVYEVTVQTSPVKVRIHRGNPDDPADSYLMGLLPDSWTSEHRLRGYSYLVVTLDLNERRFQGGPVSIQAYVKGKRVFDPRTGLTAYSENPALCTADFLNSEMWGGSSRVQVIQSDLIAAAHVCDGLIQSTDFSEVAEGITQVKRYTCNGVVSSDDDPEGILLDLTESMAGEAFVAGGWRILAGSWTAPVAELDISSADGQVEVVQVGTSWGDLINSVRGNYIPKAQAAPADIRPYVNEALKEEDGHPLWDDVSFPFTNSAARCKNLARIRVEKSRNGLILRWPASIEHWGLQPGDRVWVNYPGLGIDHRTFRVTEWSFSLRSPVTLLLEEDAPEVYDQDDQVVSDQTASINLPNPFKALEVADLSAESGTGTLVRLVDGTVVPAVRVTWTPDQSAVSGSEVVVQCTKTTWSAENPVHTVRAPAEAGSLLVPSLDEGEAYLVQARYESRWSKGKWASVPHVVQGKSEPPPPFDVFTVLAQPDGTRQLNFAYTVTDCPLDWEGAEIRYVSGSHANPEWDTMVPYQDDKTYYTASPVEGNAPLEGIWTFACRSRDSSKNLSSMKVFSVVLPKRRSGSVYEEVPNDPTWPGAKSGFVLVGGVLEAESPTTWDGDTTDWSVDMAWANNPAASASYTTPHLDLGTPIAGQVDAAVSAIGTYTVEMSYSSDNVTWSAWVPAATVFTARWVRLRVTVTSDAGSPLATLMSLDWSVSAEIKTEYLDDVNVSALTGVRRLGVGDVRAPITKTYVTIRRVRVSIQDSRTGWDSPTIVDKSTVNGPRVRFTLGGVLTDPALVDFEVEGI